MIEQASKMESTYKIPIKLNPMPTSRLMVMVMILGNIQPIHRDLKRALTQRALPAPIMHRRRHHPARDIINLLARLRVQIRGRVRFGYRDWLCCSVGGVFVIAARSWSCGSTA
jgi:hypothetical protein